MRKFERVAEPEFLAGRWEAWGLEWEKRHQANLKAQFHWHELDGEPINQRLLPVLKKQTQDHCSFCDNFPVSPPSLDTIEHFRPKSKYPRDAYRWSNLYYCCMSCQQKSDEFDEALLHSDAIDYEFDRYFRWDFTRGLIDVNPVASAADQNRARVTIEIYRLNEGHPSLRLRAQRHRAKCGGEPLEDFPYRDFLGGAGVN
jgi:uncharacterized protein (TIGR02646 family)